MKPGKFKNEDCVDYPMEKFKCKVCEKEYFDTNLYFYDVRSTKCLWCTKFPKKVKKDEKRTQSDK